MPQVMKCNVCDGAFVVPNDPIGAVIMQAHLDEHQGTATNEYLDPQDALNNAYAEAEERGWNDEN